MLKCEVVRGSFSGKKTFISGLKFIFESPWVNPARIRSEIIIQIGLYLIMVSAK
jgi:hypothetical protein